jgi:hypothetical protein
MSENFEDESAFAASSGMSKLHVREQKTLIKLISSSKQIAVFLPGWCVHAARGSEQQLAIAEDCEAVDSSLGKCTDLRRVSAAECVRIFQLELVVSKRREKARSARYGPR